MKKTTTAAILIALVLLATVPQPSFGDESEPFEGPWISNAELPPGFDHTTGPGSTVACMSLAPGDIPPCNGPIGDIRLDNPHVTSSGIILWFAAPLPGPNPFTGTLQMLLTWSHGTVDLRCSWDNNGWAGCQVISAQWPPIGAEFDVACASIPPSIGDWECGLTHTP